MGLRLELQSGYCVGLGQSCDSLLHIPLLGTDSTGNRKAGNWCWLEEETHHRTDGIISDGWIWPTDCILSTFDLAPPFASYVFNSSQSMKEHCLQSCDNTVLNKNLW